MEAWFIKNLGTTMRLRTSNFQYNYDFGVPPLIKQKLFWFACVITISQVRSCTFLHAIEVEVALRGLKGRYKLFHSFPLHQNLKDMGVCSSLFIIHYQRLLQ